MTQDGDLRSGVERRRDWEGRLELSRSDLEAIVSSSVHVALHNFHEKNQAECMFSTDEDRARHRDEHEMLRRIIKFFDRIENAKCGVWLAVLTVVAAGLVYAAWDGIKMKLTGG